LFVLAQFGLGLVRFGVDRDALAKTIVSVCDLFRAFLLVLFFWLQNQHFSLERRIGMSYKQILALQLFNFAVFAKIKIARLWNNHFFLL